MTTAHTSNATAASSRPESRDIIRARQKRLGQLYASEPAAAWVTDCARTSYRADDPLHTAVIFGPGEPSGVPIALHSAVGGESDEAVAGDILSGALATCIDSTLRAVARRLRVELEALSVEVRAEVDVRGTLCLDPQVPVGFQRMSARVELRCAPGTPVAKRRIMVQTVEHCCVVLRTLQQGVRVDTRFEDETRAESSPTSDASTGEERDDVHA